MDTPTPRDPMDFRVKTLKELRDVTLTSHKATPISRDHKMKTHDQSKDATPIPRDPMNFKVKTLEELRAEKMQAGSQLAATMMGTTTVTREVGEEEGGTGGVAKPFSGKKVVLVRRKMSPKIQPLQSIPASSILPEVNIAGESEQFRLAGARPDMVQSLTGSKRSRKTEETDTLIRTKHVKLNSQTGNRLRRHGTANGVVMPSGSRRRRDNHIRYGTVPTSEGSLALGTESNEHTGTFIPGTSSDVGEGGTQEKKMSIAELRTEM